MYICYWHLCLEYISDCFNVVFPDSWKFYRRVAWRVGFSQSRFVMKFLRMQTKLRNSVCDARQKQKQRKHCLNRWGRLFYKVASLEMHQLK